MQCTVWLFPPSLFQRKPPVNLWGSSKETNCQWSGTLRRPRHCRVASNSFKVTSKSTRWILGHPRPCEKASPSCESASKQKAVKCHEVERKRRENVSHSFRLTSKSTRWILGYPKPCEVAFQSFKLSSKSTMWIPGRPRPCEVASHPFKLTSNKVKCCGTWWTPPSLTSVGVRQDE